MAVVTQGDLTKLVSADSGVSPADVAKVLRSVFDVVGRTVAAGDRVAISNFGTWRTRLAPARIARNPQTGERVSVPAKYKPVFVYSPAVQSAVASGVAPETFRKASNR